MHVTELDPPLAAPALARTYNHPSYSDPWNCVEDYWRVQEYIADHPDAGRTKVGNALDLPPSRVRGWMNDTMPDCVRAIHVAEDNGWIGANYDDTAFRGLNVLVAWIYSGGSIERGTYRPYFTVPDTDDPDTDRLRKAAQAANITVTVSREGGAGRAPEFSVPDGGTVLGRIMYMLGAPVGSKHAERTIRLPSYLEAAPDVVRREFVHTYLLNRGQMRGDAEVLGFREERSPTYQRQLRDLIADVVGASVSIVEYNLTLSKAGTETVLEWSPPLADIDVSGERAARDLREKFHAQFETN